MQTQTTTSIHTDLTNRAPMRRRLRAVAVGVVAATAFAITLGAAPGSDTLEPTTLPIDQSAVAIWANAHGLWGGAPTSLRADPHTVGYALDLTALAAWAADNDMAGASPTSLAPAPHTTAIDQTALAVWAAENGMVGASPTSLTSQHAAIVESGG